LNYEQTRYGNDKPRKNRGIAGRPGSKPAGPAANCNSTTIPWPWSTGLLT